MQSAESSPLLEAPVVVHTPHLAHAPGQVIHHHVPRLTPTAAEHPVHHLDPDPFPPVHLAPIHGPLSRHPVVHRQQVHT